MGKRICPRDGHVSKNLTDHLVHVSLEHDHSVRRLRSVSCHRCCTEIDVNVTRTCVACGFTLPENLSD